MKYEISPYVREGLKAYRGPEPYEINYPVYWKPKLTKYHRDNLCSLLNAIGYGIKGIKPFHVFNTGDWVGEISQKLSLPVIVDGRLVAQYVINEEIDRPNQTRSAVEDSLVRWLRVRLHTIEKTSGPCVGICHIDKAKEILEIE